MKIVKVLQLVILLTVGVLLLPSGPRSLPALPAGTGSAADSVIVDWRMLAELDYRTGAVGASLRPFVDRDVMIPGFIVPLEDWASEVSEFLLVPYVGACVHTPAPPPNQLVHAHMRDDRKIEAPGWNPVWIHGRLRVEESTSVYGPAGFTVSADSVTPYEAW